MGKGSRKRKPTRRDDGGGIVPARRFPSGPRQDAPDARETVARGRLKKFSGPISRDAVKAVTLPHRGYPLGEALEDGWISEAQYRAGRRYAEDVARGNRAQGIPSRNAKVADYSEQIKGASVDMDADEARRLRAVRDDAQAALSAAGAYVRAAVDDFVLSNADLGPSMVLQCGLQVLAEHYGIAEGQRSSAA